MNTNASPSLYRYCISRSSTSAGSSFSPERMLRSMTPPVRRFFILVRVKAAPFPGLTNCASTTMYGSPSTRIFKPLRRSEVSYMRSAFSVTKPDCQFKVSACSRGNLQIKSNRQSRIEQALDAVAATSGEGDPRVGAVAGEIDSRTQPQHERDPRGLDPPQLPLEAERPEHIERKDRVAHIRIRLDEEEVRRRLEEGRDVLVDAKRDGHAGIDAEAQAGRADAVTGMRDTEAEARVQTHFLIEPVAHAHIGDAVDHGRDGGRNGERTRDFQADRADDFLMVARPHGHGGTGRLGRGRWGRRRWRCRLLRFGLRTRDPRHRNRDGHHDKWEHVRESSNHWSRPSLLVALHVRRFG